MVASTVNSLCRAPSPKDTSLVKTDLFSSSSSSSGSGSSSSSSSSSSGSNSNTSIVVLVIATINITILGNTFLFSSSSSRAYQLKRVLQESLKHPVYYFHTLIQSQPRLLSILRNINKTNINA